MVPWQYIRRRVGSHRCFRCSNERAINLTELTFTDEPVVADVARCSALCAARYGAPALSFRVAARNAFGQGEWSAPSPPLPPPAVDPPDAPTDVRCEPSGPVRMTVRWCAPTDDSGGDVLYEVIYKEEDAQGERPSSAQRQAQWWLAKASDTMLRAPPELCSAHVELPPQKRCGGQKAPDRFDRTARCRCLCGPPSHC
jgi:hypothetical protein